MCDASRWPGNVMKRTAFMDPAFCLGGHNEPDAYFITGNMSSFESLHTGTAGDTELHTSLSNFNSIGTDQGNDCKILLIFSRAISLHGIRIYLGTQNIFPVPLFLLCTPSSAPPNRDYPCPLESTLECADPHRHYFHSS